MKNDKKLILIGKIVNAVGLKGELKVYNYCETKERFETLENVYVSKNDNLELCDKSVELHKILNVRYKEHMVILKVDSCDDRNQAESLKNMYIYMLEEDLEELPEGVYYVKDLVGFDVYGDNGEFVGKLKDIDTNYPQRLYVIERHSKADVLIPGVDEFILDTDIENKRIIVKIIEGLYED